LLLLKINQLIDKDMSEDTQQNTDNPHYPWLNTYLQTYEAEEVDKIIKTEPI
jgi:hypothetical protein